MVIVNCWIWWRTTHHGYSLFPLLWYNPCTFKAEIWIFFLLRRFFALEIRESESNHRQFKFGFQQIRTTNTIWIRFQDLFWSLIDESQSISKFLIKFEAILIHFSSFVRPLSHEDPPGFTLSIPFSSLEQMFLAAVKLAKIIFSIDNSHKT